MKLITRKSECRPLAANLLVKSPKEAIRKTLSNYMIRDGYIIKAYLPSYVSKDTLVLRNVADNEDLSVQLVETRTLAGMHI